MTRYLPLLFLAGCVPEPVMVPDPPFWDHMPLSVCVETYAGAGRGQDFRLALDVIDSINREFRFEVFALGGRHCDVEVVLEAPGRPGGLSRVRGAVCHVQLSNVPPGLSYEVLRHELGHCLGLADDDRNTAMRWNTIPEEEQWPPPFFSDRDIRAIRERYGRE